MSHRDYPDQITHSVGPITAAQLALFAASSGDLNPLHLDADVAQRAGFKRPVVHGMLSMACVNSLFTRQFGVGHVTQLQTRFVGIALLGDRLDFVARLSDVVDGGADYEVIGRTQDGTAIVIGAARVQAVHR